MTTNQLEQAVSRFGLLLTESQTFHLAANCKQVADAFSEAMALNYSLYRRLTIGSRRYVVAFVGLSNVGKSTLLNALLGDELTPRRNGPCTGVPIEFQRGQSLGLRASNHNTFKSQPAISCKDTDSVHQLLEKLADGQQERKLTVTVPPPWMEPLLDSGIVLADTPGFGSATLGETGQVHEQKLRDYIATEVAQVFWIVLADQGITRREADFYDQHLKNICDDIIVTGCDHWNFKDRDRFQDRFSERIFGGKLSRSFHFVSGMLGLKARLNPDPTARSQGLQEHGITDLENRLMEVASVDSRVAVIEAEFTSLATELDDWLRSFRNAQQRVLKHPYAPESFKSWCNFYEHLKASQLIDAHPTSGTL